MSNSCIFQFLRMRWQSWVLPRSKLTWHMSTVVRPKMPTQPQKFNGSLMVLWRQPESALKHIPHLQDLQDLYLMTIPQVRAINQYWYFVTKIVLIYCEKKIVLVIEKNFWKICKIFEITRTMYSNSERSEQFLVTECFFNLFLEVSHIR